MINSNQVMKFKELDEELERFKLLFECPRLYISDYFYDLKTEIDSAFAIKQSTTTDKNVLNSNWDKIIKKVESYETECLRVRKTNKFDEEFHNYNIEAIKLLNSKLTDLKQGEQQENNAQMIKNLINENINKLEKNIFLNKTMMFLNESNCIIEIFDKLDYMTSAGKLVFITNEYFNKRNMQLIKKYYNR